MPVPPLVNALARAFLAGEPGLDSIVGRASRVLGRRWRWLRPLARRYIRASAARARPSHHEVVQFFLRDAGFRRASWKYAQELSIERWLDEPERMQPVAAALGWPLPAIESAGALAAWLSLDPAELEWFADLKGLAVRQDHALSHYHYRPLTKLSGSIRLIEAPKQRLKELQRQILTQILEQIPAHPAAHGFVKGRSIKSFVAPHAGQRVILRMDLRDFFPSIRAARIRTFFRTAGYPESVADRLSGICTNAAPRSLWKMPFGYINPASLRDARELYSRPHLPQGAPSSPALANLCAYRADCRLAGLAKSAGAVYTRYADDVAFSGGEAFERSVERFSTHAAAILSEEGFVVHHRKTRIMRQGVRQHLAGIVANRHVNVMRPDVDLLKAILTNCIRSGPSSQNRENHPNFRLHLEGRVAFVESINAARGNRLRELLDRIDWR